MNCGMEDTLVLDHFMSEKYPDDRLKAFTEYSKYRNPDAEAMCDLAMYNYIEMRDLTARLSFFLRKKVVFIVLRAYTLIFILNHTRLDIVTGISNNLLHFSWTISCSG